MFDIHRKESKDKNVRLKLLSSLITIAVKQKKLKRKIACAMIYTNNSIVCSSLIEIHMHLVFYRDTNDTFIIIYLQKVKTL